MGIRHPMSAVFSLVAKLARQVPRNRSTFYPPRISVPHTPGSAIALPAPPATPLPLPPGCAPDSPAYRYRHRAHGARSTSVDWHTENPRIRNRRRSDACAAKRNRALPRRISCPAPGSPCSHPSARAAPGDPWIAPGNARTSRSNIRRGRPGCRRVRIRGSWLNYIGIYFLLQTNNKTSIASRSSRIPERLCTFTFILCRERQLVFPLVNNNISNSKFLNTKIGLTNLTYLNNNNFLY